MLKNCIQKSLTKELASFWMNHLALVLLLLYITASQMMGIILSLDTSYQPLLSSLAVLGLPFLPKQPTLDEKKTYLREASYIITGL